MNKDKQIAELVAMLNESDKEMVLNIIKGIMSSEWERMSQQ